jgi:hypothetical protein
MIGKVRMLSPLGLLRPGRERHPQVFVMWECSGTPTRVCAIQMCHEKMHLFHARFVVRISKFAAQRRRNNFLFMPLARYINRK